MISTLDHLICGGLTFEKTAVELREKVAFRESQLPAALAAFEANEHVGKIVLKIA